MVNLKSVKKNKDAVSWKWSYAICFALVYGMVFLANFLLQRMNYELPKIVYWLEIWMLIVLLLLILINIFKQRTTYIWWETALVLLTFAGVWIFSLSILPFGWGVLLAGCLIIVPYFWQITLLNNLTVLAGSLGLGLIVAKQFPFSVLMLCTIGIIFYEFYRFSISEVAILVAEAYKAGIMPGVLVPAHIIGWFKTVSNVWKAGEGQIASVLPCVLLAATSFHILHYNFLLFFLSALGVFACGLLLGHDKTWHLRTWVFAAATAANYLVYGIVKWIV